MEDFDSNDYAQAWNEAARLAAAFIELLEQGCSYDAQ